MNTLRRLLLRSSCACSVLLASCFGGQTGQEDRAPTAIECELERIALQPDDTTQLGFSAAELEAVLAIEHVASMTWTRMSTSSQLTLRLLDVQARTLKLNGNSACVDAMELQARVVIATDDGLLDEEVVATVTAPSLDDWTLSAHVPLDALVGELDPAQLELDLSNWQEPQLSFLLRAAAQSPSALTGQISLDGDDPMPNDNASPTSASIAELSAP